MDANRDLIGKGLTANLHKCLKDGALNVQQLATALGELLANNPKAVNPWDLEKTLKTTYAGFQAMKDIGNMEYVPFTVFPADSRGRYGFPDMLPTVKGEDPGRRKRKTRNPDAKEQKQFWPIVAWGEIVPTPSGTNETAYEGQHDEDIATLRQLLDDAGFEYIRIKGRNVRGGSGIYIALAEDAKDGAEDGSVGGDTSGIVTNPEMVPVTA